MGEKIVQMILYLCHLLILISHRLSTIADTERVIVLHEGQIVGEGTHTGLLESSSFYEELVKDQILKD